MLRRKREPEKKLTDALEFGTEEDFVAAVKNFKPDVREKRGLY